MATQLAVQPDGTDIAVVAEGLTAGADGEIQTPERDFEAEARIQGWRPQEEFRGDPSKWTDAETFVKRGEEILPFVKKENAHLKQKIDMLERTVKKLSRAEQNAYANALADLKAQQLEAVQTGDVQGFTDLDKRIDALRKEVGEDAGPLTNGEDPTQVYNEFRSENQWYDKANLGSATDTEVAARLYADRTMEQLVAEGYDKSHPPSEFFAEVKARVEEKFPALTAKAVRPKPAEAVAGVTPSRGRGAAKTGANLPAEAKAAAERYVRLKIPGYANLSAVEAHNRFAQDYDWSDQ